MQYKFKDISELPSDTITKNDSKESNFFQDFAMFSIESKNDVGRFVQVSVVLSLILLLGVEYLRRKIKSNPISNHSTKRTIPTAYHFIPTFRFPILRLIDGFMTLNKLRKDGVKFLEWMVQKWGKVFTIPLGFTTVVAVTDANVIQKVLSSADPRHLNKPRQVYDFLFVDFLRDGLVASETEVWAPHRKLLSRSFTYKALCSYVKLMSTHSRDLANGLMQAARAPQLTATKTDADGIAENECISGGEMYNIIYSHTIKIISEICMGSECCTAEEAAEFHQAVCNWKRTIVHRFLNPILLVAPVWWLHPMKKEFEYYRNKIVNFMKMIINDYRRKKEMEGNSAKGDSEINETGEKPFRCMIEEMISSNLTDKEILDEFGTFLLAGHESIATAIQMLMFNLALNIDHQSACRTEVDNLFESKGITDNGHLAMEDLSDFKYLERCILESARLTTTFPMFLRRLDAPLEIDEDLQLEEGTNVVFLGWCLHRDPEHYPNPTHFNPDRFLPENVKSRHPFSFIAFSSGPRNCLGWKVALVEMKVIMAWMLRHFEISTTDKPEDVKLLFELTLLPERPFNITLTKRHK